MEADMRRYILSGEQSRLVDSYCINTMGIPSVVLMERAALTVVERLQELHKETDTYYIVCGTGNNGADGLAVARMLDDLQYSVAVGIIGDIQKATKEFQIQLEILKNTAVDWEVLTEDTVSFSRYSWVIDGIFGIGLSREVSGRYRAVIEQLNRSDCKVMAIDIPSGLHADTGIPMGVAVQADETVTFGNYKLGHKLGFGKDYCGNVLVATIGFRREAYANLLDREEPLRECFADGKPLITMPGRMQASHKGTFGKVAVIAGIGQMPGAAFFAAKAAYLCGAGLVKVITAEDNTAIMKTNLPEALTYGISKEMNWQETVKQLLGDCKAIIIGPGFGTDAFAEDLLAWTLQEHAKEFSDIPVVMDADALNIMAKNRDLFQYLNKQYIITPHLLEMARLLQVEKEQMMQTPLSYAEEFVKDYHCTCVLKSATTIVASMDTHFQTYINLTGNSGMAKGGSGDVLAGMIGGMLAQMKEIPLAAQLCVWLHGKAGDLAAGERTEYSVLASDLLNYIPRAIAYTIDAYMH